MMVLEVACRRCERRGRLRIERLIAEHGAGVLELRAIVAAQAFLLAARTRAKRRSSRSSTAKDRHPAISPDGG